MERVNYVCAKYGLLLDVVGPKLQVRPILHPSYTKFTPILHQLYHTWQVKFNQLNASSMTLGQLQDGPEGAVRMDTHSLAEGIVRLTQGMQDVAVNVRAIAAEVKALSYASPQKKMYTSVSTRARNHKL